MYGYGCGCSILVRFVECEGTQLRTGTSFLRGLEEDDVGKCREKDLVFSPKVLTFGCRRKDVGHQRWVLFFLSSVRLYGQSVAKLAWILTILRQDRFRWLWCCDKCTAVLLANVEVKEASSKSGFSKIT